MIKIINVVTLLYYNLKIKGEKKEEDFTDESTTCMKFNLENDPVTFYCDKPIMPID